MNPLTNVPEHLRGWIYVAITVILLVGLVTMFVISVLNGDDLSQWLPIILGGLGLAGTTGMAASNTSRQK